MLDLAMKHNVPALLADLTNSVRHGDICLMGGSDPYLLEVKALNKLVRQARKGAEKELREAAHIL